MVEIAGTIKNVGQSLLGVGIIVIVLVITVAVIGGAFWLYSRWKRYRQFRCKVWEKDGFGQWVQDDDDAGIFYDKAARSKRLFLRKNNVSLPADKIPYIPQGTAKFIYLYKWGLKNFSFIHIDVQHGGLELNATEEDVNWAGIAYEKQKKLAENNWITQVLPYATLAFVSICILVLFLYFFKDFEVLKEMSQNMLEASRELAKAKMGTTVISSP